ncbi:hypothetical protein CDD81_3068 [Ophiocordyceps australis]|uniref:Uncharacterized protein n=1 Tax=Ophiocordyceps australis TaxID=1399860 RepID=A0A2C5XAU3_9HYPO|nr:hypothetical protein CDD81_3068 [Ophiocordyceps australis]
MPQTGPKQKPLSRLWDSAAGDRLFGSVKTSPQKLSTVESRRAHAQGADGDGDLDSSPFLPALPAPSLPGRVAQILRTPPAERDAGDFGTASWGSPYPRSDHNLRRRSFSSEPSEDTPIHHLNIDTPFLRPQPGLAIAQAAESATSVSAAAAVLANRVRRQNRGLTEDWIRTHTAGLVNAEPKHWFSEGSDTENSSLSGSEVGWLDDRDPRTPKASRSNGPRPAKRHRHPRGRSSLETLRPQVLGEDATPNLLTMESLEHMSESVSAYGQEPEDQSSTLTRNPTEKDGIMQDAESSAEQSVMPVPEVQQPSSEAPMATKRVTKKKVPWKGKNIMILLPRDDRRGLAGTSSMPLSSQETEKMYESWRELGYNTSGFDLRAENSELTGQDDSKSRQSWPSSEDMALERAQGRFKVTLPDLNAWKNYVHELQEAKLRALGVSFADDDAQEAAVSPQRTEPSRQASTQHQTLPFSPPIPPSSVSSNQAGTGPPFPGQYIPASQSPGLSSGASPMAYSAASAKFNPHQTIPIPAGSPQFSLASQQTAQGWSNQTGLQGMGQIESPSMASLNGLLSPQSSYGFEGVLQPKSPGFSVHDRQQTTMQYMSQQTVSGKSPHLPEVDKEVATGGKRPSQSSEADRRNRDSLQAEIDEAEYHLEEQLRNQFEHEDYNPQLHSEGSSLQARPFEHNHEAYQPSTQSLGPRLAEEPGRPLILHHPRPHSREHSLSQSFFRDHNQGAEGISHDDMGRLASLSEAPELHKNVGDSQEIETNPSNLGTPIPNFDVEAVLKPHQKTLSNASNPWQDSASVTSSNRPTSHGSKLSYSKLNVQAPEFKFNPNASLTTGLFNFAGDISHAIAPSGGNTFGTNPLQGSSVSAKFHATAPSFSPGQSDFSFSSTGPKFRPDAPAFQPQSGALFSPIGSGSESASNRNSIFSNIDLGVNTIIKPQRTSKAVPIVKPSSNSSTMSAEHPDSIHEAQEGPDGRLADESRVKRARSLAPETKESSLFADFSNNFSVEHASRNAVDETSSADDASTLGGDNAPPFDTSSSSMPTTADVEGKENAAPVSELSATGKTIKNWNPFEFDSKFEIHSFKKAHALNDDGFIIPEQTRSPSEEPGANKRKVEEAEGTFHSSRQSTPVAARPMAAAKGLSSSRFAPQSKKAEGLAASHFARLSTLSAEMSSHTPAEENVLESIEDRVSFTERLIDVGHVREPTFEESVMQHFRNQTPDGGMVESVEEAVHLSQKLIDLSDDREPTFEEIDAVMQHLKDDPSMGVNKTFDSSNWRQLAPAETRVPVEQTEALVNAEAAMDKTDSTPRRDKESTLLTTEVENPFVDPSGRSSELEDEFDEADMASDAVSDWEATFSEDEHSKLGTRAQFFDGRVNQVLGNLLDSRLEPLEKTMSSIQHTLTFKGRRPPSSRREMRSISGDMRESDADDEDEEPIPRRSMSPRRDRRLDQIRVVVMEALAAQQSMQQPGVDSGGDSGGGQHWAMAKTLDEMKEQLATAVQARAESADMAAGQPILSEIHEELQKKMEALQSKVEEAEQRLGLEQARVEKEISERRAAEDAAAELNRKLQAAETRVEVEIINRSVFDQRVTDLEERLRHQEDKTEEEVKMRRAAEDRLSEVQRLLRISSEEENRLRETIEEKNQVVKDVEQERGKAAVRMSLLEAAQANATQLQSDMTNTINVLEADLRAVRQDNSHWRTEAERSDEIAHGRAGELAHVREENKHLQKSLGTLASQLEENERLREAWRTKFMSLQDDMAQAVREVAQENAQRIKKQQAMLARQEVLDARLQAEAKTRERLEVEMERLQENERAGMRAVNECKRLEALLAETRGHNDKLQQTAGRYQREFEEARESGASEVKRTRMAMQLQVDAANNQVNVIRQELEEQNAKLRAEVDSARLEADTAKAQSEMLVEEAQASRTAEIEQLKREHQNQVEDLQTSYECRMSDANEESQKAEQHLLDRLSLSSSKIEHLQDRIVHLQDKLDVAHTAKAGPDTAGGGGPGTREARQEELPAKISPQALRESILVLQEQLQAREQRIEELEQLVAKMDPDAASKICKRDDEIGWLRELLDVRQGDLAELIGSLSADDLDRDVVRDTAIRLRANMDMMEQERTRARNGGSGISLPNIAQSIQAATPRVAQTIGPIAAAWGNWRRSHQQPRRKLPAEPSRTPSRPRSSHTSHESVLGGLLTPPASGLRQMASLDTEVQPTAFASTGRRYTSQALAESVASGPSQGHGTGPFAGFSTHEHRDQQRPLTPPMMRQAGYDLDAQPGDFDDHDFFQDD